MPRASHKSWKSPTSLATHNVGARSCGADQPSVARSASSIIFIADLSRTSDRSGLRVSLDELGHALVARLALVRRVRDGPRDHVVLLAVHDKQRAPLWVLRVDLRLGPR